MMARKCADRRGGPPRFMPSEAMAHDTILIVDFGSQVTQLIARRVREAGVFSVVAPFQEAAAAFAEHQPKGVIFSGGPSSTHMEGSPRAPQEIYDSGVPLMGICYGQMAMNDQLGGRVEGSDHREFGRAEIEVIAKSPLIDGIWSPGEMHTVWMSHGDRVVEPAPGFEVIARSPGAPFAVIANDERRAYGLMFHPEVVHTPDGARLIESFVRRIVGATGDWTMAAFREEAIAKIRADRGRWPRDLRPLGRRQLHRDRRASGGGHRRPAHVHLRRPRPPARERGRAGRADVRRPQRRDLQQGGCVRDLPHRARGRHGPGGRSARPSAGSSSRCSRRRPRP